jgi:hypothetical protein
MLSPVGETSYATGARRKQYNVTTARRTAAAKTQEEMNSDAIRKTIFRVSTEPEIILIVKSIGATGYFSNRSMVDIFGSSKELAVPTICVMTEVYSDTFRRAQEIIREEDKVMKNTVKHDCQIRSKSPRHGIPPPEEHMR